MAESNPSKIKAVRNRLASFSRLEVPPKLSEAHQQEIREALLWFSELADYETLGVCADTLPQAQAALEAYIASFSHPVKLDLEKREGAVYLKFNTLNSTWYLDDYIGASRGVLIAYHASEPEVDAVNGTYGPFPLDLFG